MYPVRKLFGNGRLVQSGVRAMSAKGPLVDLAVDGEGIAVLTMQRPPVNSLNLDLLQAMSSSLDEVAKNKCKGMILTSGHAPAGGCLLAMSCEYRAMVNGKYTIGLNETALGIVAPNWFMHTMCNTISQREAEYALTTARMFSVDEALKAIPKIFSAGLDLRELYKPDPERLIQLARAMQAVFFKLYGSEVTTTVAINVQMIDEIAMDKKDAIEKCKKFIRLYDNINKKTQGAAKRQLRQSVINYAEENREEDAQALVRNIMNSHAQEQIGKYVEQLKNKKAK
ncbi:Enoyl-CoA delta isomerase 1 [Operophtera brumata]|uniref:Enoyl-CoA delta isomerase 1 n=1 Tax=Operophtera brumata TaxID=104452 RepID=A0A0L7L2Q3_OPEBR|nr:Enoyl-CoA delta isomerase 1 [Operophtera brumata]